MSTPFPASFVLGAGTSAFQIEGALGADGRGKSIWDDFMRTRRGPGADTADVACDHYHRVDEDVALMRALGLGAYRFSIAWPRVLPAGRGQVNAKGLDFYARLVDRLLEANIMPFATLYHWDLPTALEGGWQARDTAQAFADYAGIVARALGDRVPYFSTLHEPNAVMFQGYVTGDHPPGQKSLGGLMHSLHVMHHLLLAHGLGTQAIRAVAPAAKIGIANALGQIYPATDSDKDRAAAANAQQINLMFLQPLFTGAYHKALMNGLLGLPRRIKPGDMEAIAQPVDFLGVNNYTRGKVKRVRFSLLGYEGIVPDPAEVECTDLGWEVAPAALYDLLMWLAREYPRTRLVVTENGAAYHDVVDASGAIDDERRVSYLERHLREVQRALADGCPIDAYFVWSLLDGFDWTHGYAKRFGLVHVDHATQKRTIKKSGRWYERVCRERRLDGASASARASTS